MIDNAIFNCVVCTPARAMLVTGRYAQATGHLINTTRTRHSEISLGDTFAHWGHKTGWVGKWYLHTGLSPAIDRMPLHEVIDRVRLTNSLSNLKIEQFIDFCF